MTYLASVLISMVLYTIFVHALIRATHDVLDRSMLGLWGSLMLLAFVPYGNVLLATVLFFFAVIFYAIIVCQYVNGRFVDRVLSWVNRIFFTYR